MKDRKAILFCGSIVVFLLALSVITRSKQPNFPASAKNKAQAQDDPKAGIKHKRREARYGTPYDQSRVLTPLSEQKEGGIFNIVFIDYVETKDLNDVAVRTALKNEDLANRQKLACEADLVMLGEVVKANGVITDDDRFIYTVYTIYVIDAYRTSADVQVKSGDVIEMTAPGGIINLDEKHRLDFRYPALIALTVNNQYIFYLKYDSEAGDFYFFNQSGVYETQDGGKLQRMDAMMDNHLASHARAAAVPDTLTQLKTEIEQTTCGK